VKHQRVAVNQQRRPTEKTQDQIGHARNTTAPAEVDLGLADRAGSALARRRPAIEGRIIRHVREREIGPAFAARVPEADQSTDGSRPRVVLVHDYLLVMRGAERTFAALAEHYSDAPIATLLYDEAGTSGRFSGREIITSPLQRLGVSQAAFRR